MLNFEFVSYQGKLMNQHKQLSKDSLQLICYKKMIAQQERSSKALETSFGCCLRSWLRKMKKRKKLSTSS
nr:protein suppressor of gene silencing 3 [Tanacetum cinerariifolium]